MQEKVQTSQEIKIVEQPPPSAQVQKNIEHFIEITATTDFLNDVKNYAQGLQKNKLSKSRLKKAAVKENMLPIPEKGAKEVADTASFNSTQALMKTTLEHLDTMISDQMKLNPNLKSKLAKHDEDLKQIAKDFPQLSSEQIDKLGKIQFVMYEMHAILPDLQKRPFIKINLELAQDLRKNESLDPSKYSPEEIAKYIQHLAQKIDVELEYLTALDPSDQANSGQLKTHGQSLKGINSTSPTQADIKSLASITKDVNRITSEIHPASGKQEFWNSTMNMLQELRSTNKANIDDLESEVKELGARNTMLKEVAHLLDSMGNTLKASSPSNEQFQQFIENAQKVGNSLPQMSPDQQTEHVAFFNQLGAFKSANGQGLDQYMSDSIVSTKTQEFLSANPNATAEQVSSHLNTFLQNSNLLSSRIPFMQSLGNAIKQTVNKEGFPLKTGFSNLPFATQEKGKVSAQKDFGTTFLKSFAPKPETITSFTQATESFKSSLNSEINANQPKIEGYQHTQITLGKAQEAYGRAEAGAAAAGKGKGQGSSLPNKFYQAILNHYMQRQEAYLMGLSFLLEIDNMGSELGNTLLQKTLGFGSAASQFDFGNNLSGTPPKFDGSYADAVRQWNKEKESCATRAKQANAAEKAAESKAAYIRNKLKNDKNLTPAQREKLTKMLNGLVGIIGNLVEVVKQLDALKFTLDHILIEDKGGTGHFEVKAEPPLTSADWQTKLDNGESNVINGNINAKPPAYQGGLLNVNSDITSFQQMWSDQSENQQMILQMRLTEIQQEWSVVSTALQLLNQMYMTLARSLYKG